MKYTAIIIKQYPLNTIYFKLFSLQLKIKYSMQQINNRTYLGEVAKLEIVIKIHPSFKDKNYFNTSYILNKTPLLIHIHLQPR